MWRYLEQYGVRHLIRVLAGWMFIVLGLVGLVVPLLQGVLFLTVGALLLAPYVPLFRRIKVRLYRRFPAVRRTVERLKRRLKEMIPRRA